MHDKVNSFYFAGAWQSMPSFLFTVTKDSKQASLGYCIYDRNSVIYMQVVAYQVRSISTLLQLERSF